MRKSILMLCFVLSANAADYQFHLTPDSTHVAWTVGDVLHTVHGTFRLKRGDIVFDPAGGKAGGEVVVDTASGESGSSARDGRMHKNVLESVKFPEASFVPDRMEGAIQLTGTSEIKLHGMFTIHGAAHEITVPVRVIGKGDQIETNIKFEVPFVAWGMKDPSTLFLKVNKLVEIEIESTGRISPAHQ